MEKPGTVKMRLFIFLANSEVQRNQRKSQASFQRKIGPNTWKSKIALLLSSLLKKSREIGNFRNYAESEDIVRKVKTNENRYKYFLSIILQK